MLDVLEAHGPAGAALYVDAWARGEEPPDEDRLATVAAAWSEDEWLEGRAAVESERVEHSDVALSSAHEPRLTREQYATLRRIEEAEAAKYRSPINELLRARLAAEGWAERVELDEEAEEARFQVRRAALDADPVLAAIRARIAGQARSAPPLNPELPWSQFDPPRQSKLAAKERAFEAKVAARAAVERRTGAPDDDPRVTRNPIRRGVLRVLDDLARVRVAFPSVRWLAARLMCSTRTVRRHLEDLNAWGYLSRHARFWRSGVQRSCLWVPRRPETHEGHVGSAKARVDWLAARETLPRWLRLDTRPQKPSPNPPQDIARMGCVGGSGKLTLGVTPDRVCSVPNEPHRTLRVATEQRSREHAHRQTPNAHPISCAPS